MKPSGWRGGKVRNGCGDGGGGVKPALGQLWSPVPSLRLNLSYCPDQQQQQHGQAGEGEEGGASIARLLTVSMSSKLVRCG